MGPSAQGTGRPWEGAQVTGLREAQAETSTVRSAQIQRAAGCRGHVGLCRVPPPRGAVTAGEGRVAVSRNVTPARAGRCSGPRGTKASFRTELCARVFLAAPSGTPNPTNNPKVPSTADGHTGVDPSWDGCSVIPGTNDGDFPTWLNAKIATPSARIPTQEWDERCDAIV